MFAPCAIRSMRAAQKVARARARIEHWGQKWVCSDIGRVSPCRSGDDVTYSRAAAIAFDGMVRAEKDLLSVHLESEAVAKTRHRDYSIIRVGECQGLYYTQVRISVTD